MRRLTLNAMACAAVLAGLPGCGGNGDGSGDGADGAARAYVEASNDRDFGRVCDVLSEGLKQALHITDNCPAALQELSSGGGRPTLELLGVQASGDRATANVEVTPEGGQAAQVQVTLERQNGDWRITSLGPSPAD